MRVLSLSVVLVFFLVSGVFAAGIPLPETLSPVDGSALAVAVQNAGCAQVEKLAAKLFPDDESLRHFYDGLCLAYAKDAVRATDIAEHLIMEEAYDEVTVLADTIIARNGMNREAARMKALALFRSGDAAGASAFLKTIPNIEAGDPLTWLAIDIEIERLNLEKARFLLNIVIKKEDAYRVRMARLEQLSGNDQSALENARQVTEKDSDSYFKAQSLIFDSCLRYKRFSCVEEAQIRSGKNPAEWQDEALVFSGFLATGVQYTSKSIYDPESVRARIIGTEGAGGYVWVDVNAVADAGMFGTAKVDLLNYRSFEFADENTELQIHQIKATLTRFLSDRFELLFPDISYSYVLSDDEYYMQTTDIGTALRLHKDGVVITFPVRYVLTEFAEGVKTESRYLRGGVDVTWGAVVWGTQMLFTAGAFAGDEDSGTEFDDNTRVGGAGGVTVYLSRSASIRGFFSREFLSYTNTGQDDHYTAAEIQYTQIIGKKLSITAGYRRAANYSDVKLENYTKDSVQAGLVYQFF